MTTNVAVRTGIFYIEFFGLLKMYVKHLTKEIIDALKQQYTFSHNTTNSNHLISSLMLLLTFTLGAISALCIPKFRACWFVREVVVYD